MSSGAMTQYTIYIEAEDGTVIENTVIATDPADPTTYNQSWHRENGEQMGT